VHSDITLPLRYLRIYELPFDSSLFHRFRLHRRLPVVIDFIELFSALRIVTKIVFCLADRHEDCFLPCGLSRRLFSALRIATKTVFALKEPRRQFLFRRLWLFVSLFLFFGDFSFQTSWSHEVIFVPQVGAHEALTC